MIKILKSRRRNSAMTAVVVPIFVFFFISLLLFTLSLFFSPQSLSFQNRRPPPLHLSTAAVAADHHGASSSLNHHQQFLDSKSVLFPEWIVFNIIPSSSSQDDAGDGSNMCVFQNNVTSPAVYAGTLSGNRRSYKCVMPNSVRGLRQFLTPALTKSESVNVTELDELEAINWNSRPRLPRWNLLVYDSLSTASDVVVFAKNVNRVGHVRSPSTLRCVFTHESNLKQVTTQVTSSDQEVFRCTHPPSSELLPEGSRISLTLEVIEEEKGSRKSERIPSVATYETRSSQRLAVNSSSLCACTMVHNVGKFLKEWVMYHSAIGVEKFILYDNDSDDETGKTYVHELVDLGYNVETVFWPWPKAQEAGFSHSVIYSKSYCKWMVFVDVDEFVFSPKWTDSTKPSHDMLSTLLMLNETGRRSKQVGQVMIQCHDFGPSNQTSHPRNGVTQGYTCRRKLEERHKSIVRLDAVDESLQNSVHHFKIKSNVYKTQKVRVDKAAVNHYKYQAWPEFKTKFKRRVSTYVVDWTENISLNSKDRTPGLGVEAVEPQGWAMKFCEVVDTRLQLLTRKWFGRKVQKQNQSNVKMAWER